MPPKVKQLPQVLQKKKDDQSLPDNRYQNVPLYPVFSAFSMDKIPDATLPAMMKMDSCNYAQVGLVEADLLQRRALIKYYDLYNEVIEYVPLNLIKLQSSKNYGDSSPILGQPYYIDDSFFKTPQKYSSSSIAQSYMIELKRFTIQQTQQNNVVLQQNSHQNFKQFCSECLIAAKSNQIFSERVQKLQKLLEIKMKTQTLYSHDLLNDLPNLKQRLASINLRGYSELKTMEQIIISQMYTKMIESIKSSVQTQVNTPDQLYNYQSTQITENQLIVVTYSLKDQKIVWDEINEEIFKQSLLKISEIKLPQLVESKTNKYERMEWNRAIAKAQNTDFIEHELNGSIIDFSIIFSNINLIQSINTVNKVLKIVSNLINVVKVENSQQLTSLKENFIQLSHSTQIIQQIPQYITVGFVTINLSELKLQLEQNAYECQQILRLNINRIIHDQIEEQYNEISKKQNLFVQVPNSPSELIDLQQIIQQLKPYILKTYNQAEKLLQMYLDYGYLCNEEISPSIYDYLSIILELNSKKSFTNNQFSHQQRVFTKMLLEFTDYVQFYCQQIELISTDILKYRPDQTLDEIHFKRNYRWLHLGIVYEPLKNYFDYNQELLPNFIKSVEQTIGFSLELENNSFKKQITEQFNFQRFLQETIYVCGALVSMYDIIMSWAKTLNVECFITINPHNLTNMIQPICSVSLTSQIVSEQFNDMLDMYVRDANVNNIVKSIEQILKSIKYIREKEQYLQWIAFSDNIEKQVINIYPQCIYIQHLQDPCMNSYHYMKMSQITAQQINSDLCIKCKDLIDINEQRFEYMFSQCCEVHENAKYNLKYLTFSQQIFDFIQKIETIQIHYEIDSRIDYQFYQNIDFVGIKNDTQITKILNQYLLELSQFLQLGLNQSTQKYIREVEQQLLQIQQFLISTARLRNVIIKICDKLNDYQSTSNYEKIHFIIKQSIYLMQKIGGNKIALNQLQQNPQVLKELSIILDELDLIILNTFFFFLVGCFFLVFVVCFLFFFCLFFCFFFVFFVFFVLVFVLFGFVCFVFVVFCFCFGFWFFCCLVVFFVFFFCCVLCCVFCFCFCGVCVVLFVFCFCFCFCFCCVFFFFVFVFFFFVCVCFLVVFGFFGCLCCVVVFVCLVFLFVFWCFFFFVLFGFLLFFLCCFFCVLVLFFFFFVFFFFVCFLCFWWFLVLFLFFFCCFVCCLFVLFVWCFCCVVFFFFFCCFFVVWFVCFGCCFFFVFFFFWVFVLCCFLFLFFFLFVCCFVVVFCVGFFFCFCVGLVWVCVWVVWLVVFGLCFFFLCFFGVLCFVFWGFWFGFVVVVFFCGFWVCFFFSQH
ncbi:Conserved_hypothetical protein [Hexamita inflata]|uniref:Dynein heavy chain n=1 Tax=Hexamita inflata TaxID=28002 RepID=A0ABP1HIX9_9EUKA